MKIVFATTNAGKMAEVKALLADLPIEVISAAEAGVTEDIIEDGLTFAANAKKKAEFVAAKCGLPAIADDSGICIKELDYRPGVFSARWAGERASDSDIVNFTLEQAKEIPDGERQAYFECAACLAAPDGRHWVFIGKVEGSLAPEPRGAMRPGLAYDVIFIPAGSGRTFGEMTDAEKNRLSHRGMAFAKLKDFLAKNINPKLSKVSKISEIST